MEKQEKRKNLAQAYIAELDNLKKIRRQEQLCKYRIRDIKDEYKSHFKVELLPETSLK